MRILIVGAGATGGYFGGRLLQAGRDVTFLVRPPRVALLRETGLRIASPTGDATLPAPPTVTSDRISAPFDLILLSCKAYDLEAAMASLAPAVGPGTAILPLLNGMRHLTALEQRFGAEAVLGGQCVISSTLREDGTIVHLNTAHLLTFGERDGGASERIGAIAAAFAGAKFDARASDAIVQEMWEKWVLLASMAGSTSLMRAPLGAIVAAPGGESFILAALEECRAVAAAAGYPPRPAYMADTTAFLTTAGSKQTSSMFRDISRGARIEADHIIGDMIARAGDSGLKTPRLDVIYCHLKAYEASATTA